MFFPSPKPQKSCRPSCPQPASPCCITVGREREAEPAQSVPTPGTSARTPQDGGTLQTGEPWQPAAPAQVAAPSQQSHKAAAGWKADLEGAKALVLCPSGAPQLHNGDTVYVPSVLNYLDGSQKAQTSLCLCLVWGSAGSSLVEAAQSCLLPAPAASYLLWAAKRSCVFSQPEQHRLSTQQGSPHTGRTPPGCWSQAGTLPEARSSISVLSLCKPPWHTAGRGRAVFLDENHIYFTDTELHWWLILHTPGTHSSGALWAGPGCWGRIHTEKFVSSEGPINRQDGAPHSWAAPTPVKDRNIK